MPCFSRLTFYVLRLFISRFSSLVFFSDGTNIRKSRLTYYENVVIAFSAIFKGFLHPGGAMKYESTFYNLPFFLIFFVITISVAGQEHTSDHNINREKIDEMRDEILQPEKIIDVIGVSEGMIIGEAGVGYGYFTFKLSNNVGTKGIIFANDIDESVLKILEERNESEGKRNIQTVLGTYNDPCFPQNNLDMIIVFDCLFEFSHPFEWIKKSKKYLKSGGKLIIVDPDPAKIKGEDFISRQKVKSLAQKSGFSFIEIDDSFLSSHMILSFQHNQD